MKYKKVLEKKKPRLLDCRKIDGHMSSLSFSPRSGGFEGMVAAHEGKKPNTGDYLALDNKGQMALYRVTSVNYCMNVDPPNMWIAQVEFVPGRVAQTLDDVPSEFS